MTDKFNKNKTEQNKGSDEVSLIYRCKFDSIDNCETVTTCLTKLSKTKILELKEIIHGRSETYESWIVSDDAKQRVMIWGRLKFGFDVDIYGFKDHNIEFVRKALNGCDGAYAELETDALLYSGYTSFNESKGIVECFDYECTPQKAMQGDICLEQLLVLRELMVRHRKPLYQQ